MSGGGGLTGEADKVVTLIGTDSERSGEARHATRGGQTCRGVQAQVQTGRATLLARGTVLSRKPVCCTAAFMHMQPDPRQKSELLQRGETSTVLA